MINLKSLRIKYYAAVLLCACMMALSGCSNGTASYDGFERKVASQSSLVPVDSVFDSQSYEGEDALYEETEVTFSSDDGLCVIEKKPSYYDVTLDYTKGDYYAVGSAYAEAIKRLDVDFVGVLEPYLYENVKMAFPSLNEDYSPVVDRINVLLTNIPEDYRNEMEGFAKTISDGKTGMENDGILSYEEALLMHMVPDTLRGTNCNALSVWGKKTESGERIISRTLEWTLGSENQMCSAHAVTHFKMPEGKKSYTTFSVLGMLDMLTGINENGVFAGILDVGSEVNYVCEGKKCYTYELRYALENMDDARSVGEYMVSESKNFTYSHNVFINDKENTFVAEDCAVDLEDEDTRKDFIEGLELDVNDKDLENILREYGGFSILREADTPLIDGIKWDNPDSLCVVNSFMTEGNRDYLTGGGNNLVRFSKFNAWVGEKDKLTLADVKSIVTRETIDNNSKFQKIHSDNVFHTIIYDYGTGEMDITFTGTEGVQNHPEFVRVNLD